MSPMTVGEVYDQHLCTPPKPSTNTVVQHPHPCDETPVGAGGGGGGGGGEEGGVGGRGKRRRRGRWSRSRRGRRRRRRGGGEGEEGGRESEGEKKEQEVVVEAALFLQGCQKTASREQLRSERGGAAAG